MRGIQLLFSSHFLTLVFLESLEKRDLRKAWRSEGGARSSEGGGA